MITCSKVKMVEAVEVFGSKRDWLVGSEELHVRLSSKAEEVLYAVEALFPKLLPAKIKNGRKISRYKDALKCILSNLYHAWQCGSPLRVSFNKNDYRHGKRYSQLYFKYDRMIPLIDAMIEQKFIFTHPWYHEAGKCGWQTRIWATPKLMELYHKYDFHKPGIIEKLPPVEIIKLNKTKDNAKKVKINYKDDDRTYSMRNWLTEYNRFMEQQEITLHLDGDVEMNLHSWKNFYPSMNKGVVSPIHVQPVCKDIKDTVIYSSNKSCSNSSIINKYTGSGISMTKEIRDYPVMLGGYDDNFIYQDLDYGYEFLYDCVDHQYKELFNIHNDITTTISKMSNSIQCAKNEGNGKVEKYLKRLRQEKLKEKVSLKHYGLSELNFLIKYNHLHRVFNNGSFDEGGRFFGAYHQRLNKKKDKMCLRPCIKINGYNTVELDYSAEHIRMLYQKEGIDYRADPYGALCTNDDERPLYKLVQLIAINAKNEKSAVQALRNLVMKDDSIECPLTNEFIYGLIDKFKNNHPLISQYLYSGIGLELQNTDSNITEAILIRLMKQNVPCLPVHDSYIVPEQYEGILAEAMVEEYEKLMGYKPVIG